MRRDKISTTKGREKSTKRNRLKSPGSFLRTFLMSSPVWWGKSRCQLAACTSRQVNFGCQFAACTLRQVDFGVQFAAYTSGQEVYSYECAVYTSRREIVGYSYAVETFFEQTIHICVQNKCLFAWKVLNLVVYKSFAIWYFLWKILKPKPSA